MTARNSQITTAALLQLEEYSVETYGNPFSYNFDVKIIPLDSSKTTFTVLKMKRYERQGTQKQRDALSEQQLLLQFERDVINELNNFDTTRIFSSFGYRELIK